MTYVLHRSRARVHSASFPCLTAKTVKTVKDSQDAQDPQMIRDQTGQDALSALKGANKSQAG